MKHYSWAVLWAIVVLVLCSIPSESTDSIPKFPGIDKLVHSGFFFVFTVLLYYGAIRKGGTARPSWGITMRVIIFSFLFALFTEFLQWKIFTYRSAEAWDLFADVVGTGMGVFAYLLLHNSYRIKVRTIHFTVGAAIAVSLSACSVFRKGCKCPPVHRYVPVAIHQPPLQSFGDGNGTHLHGPSSQQHSRTGFKGSARGQYVVH
ncbi:VanZ family protein [Parapedobacter defluvii]|uniref:VanZ family protein n=1 Tax=Parapedobacter defluvii TaxID=2045106 RepID=UPI003341D180